MIDWRQYAVILREGKDGGLKLYTCVNKNKIEEFFDNFKFGEQAKNSVEMGHIVGQTKREITDKINFYKRNIGSLVFNCKNEQTANKCAEYWKFPLPFPNHQPNL